LAGRRGPFKGKGLFSHKKLELEIGRNVPIFVSDLPKVGWALGVVILGGK